jgi:hypothetical protein
MTIFYCLRIETSLFVASYDSQGYGGGIRPSLHKGFLCFQVQLQNYVTTDGQSASLSWNKAPICGLRPDFHYCQIIASLFIWGALSNERAGVFYNVQYIIYLHFVCYYLNVYTIYTRPLSVQAQYSKSCPIFSSFLR